MLRPLVSPHVDMVPDRDLQGVAGNKPRDFSGTRGQVAVQVELVRVALENPSLHPCLSCPALLVCVHVECILCSAIPTARREVGHSPGKLCGRMKRFSVRPSAH
jgi:hypothetical protein